MIESQKRQVSGILGVEHLLHTVSSPPFANAVSQTKHTPRRLSPCWVTASFLPPLVLPKASADDAVVGPAVSGNAAPLYLSTSHAANGMSHTKSM